MVAACGEGLGVTFDARITRESRVSDHQDSQHQSFLMVNGSILTRLTDPSLARRRLQPPSLRRSSPGQGARGLARYQSVCRHIVRHQSSCSDQGMLADRDAAQNHCATADRRSGSHYGWLQAPITLASDSIRQRLPRADGGR